MNSNHKSRIAVLGSGAAGLSAAWLLDKSHDVTLFEKNDYLGGHTNTIVLPDGPDAGQPIDTGFIVFNNRNYPTLLKFFDRLGIWKENSDMSFGFSRKNPKIEYNSFFPNGLFAQRANLFRPSFIRMIKDIFRFNDQAKSDLEKDKLNNVTLGDYVDSLKLGSSFKKHYLIPMGAAIWSTPLDKMLDFPAATFLRFFYNHGLLDLKNRPQWYYVAGGSATYVKRITKEFRGNIVTNANIEAIRRSPSEVTLSHADGKQESFDFVVIGTHADEALQLLADPSPIEQELLGAWEYTKNEAVLHADDSAMPTNKRAWASWNYILEPEEEAESNMCLTYHMNRLQCLKTEKQYFVTLNRKQPLDESKVIKRIHYTHPMFTKEAVATQSRLPELNGIQRTFFCGSYFGYGFHEDAVKSGIAVAEGFGLSL